MGGWKEVKNLPICHIEKSLVLSEWMDGWMGGWMGTKNVLRIAYSNKKGGRLNLTLNFDIKASSILRTQSS